MMTEKVRLWLDELLSYGDLPELPTDLALALAASAGRFHSIEALEHDLVPESAWHQPTLRSVW